MKKLLSLILVLILTCSMAACVTVENDIIPPNAATNAAQGETQSQPDTPAPAQDSTIEETVLLDENGVKVTAKSLETGTLFGAELKLLIENNTDKNLTFQSTNASVNGYMVQTIMSVDVAAGKKANDSLTFMQGDLDLCDIKTIADMEFSFHVFHTDDWSSYMEDKAVKLQTSAAATYTYTYDDSGTPVYDANGMKIVVKGLSPDNSILGDGLIVYLYNSSDAALCVQTRDCSVNGFMMDPLFSQDVGPGKHAISAITFMDTDLEANSITQITDVELSFHIFDAESWMDAVDTDPITLNFS